MWDVCEVFNNLLIFCFVLNLNTVWLFIEHVICDTWLHDTCWLWPRKLSKAIKMVLRQPPSRQQVEILYDMTPPSSLWNASPQATYVQRHARRQCATTQKSSIKCCSNLGATFEALPQYYTAYLYKMPFPQALIWFIGATTCNFSIKVCTSRYMPVICGNTRGGLQCFVIFML